MAPAKELAQKFNFFFNVTDVARYSLLLASFPF